MDKGLVITTVPDQYFSFTQGEPARFGSCIIRYDYLTYPSKKWNYYRVIKGAMENA